MRDRCSGRTVGRATSRLFLRTIFGRGTARMSLIEKSRTSTSNSIPALRPIWDRIGAGITTRPALSMVVLMVLPYHMHWFGGFFRRTQNQQELTAEIESHLQLHIDDLIQSGLSPVSVWELLMLADKGRLEFAGNADEWLSAALEKGPMREAPLTFDIARQSRCVDLPHEDPADRFLAATAKILALTLVTADERLRHSSDFSTLFNK